MVTALIVDLTTGERMGTCCGPDPDGRCPRIDELAVVPCAGHTLRATAPQVGWELTIPVGAHATACPLRGFVVASGWT